MNLKYLSGQEPLPIIKGSLISFFSNKVKLNGGTNLAQGIPGLKPPQKLLEIFADTLKEDIHQYAPGVGNKMLLDKIYAKHSETNNTTKIFITNGATEAVALIYSYLHNRYKDELNAMSFSPAYESYIHLPQIYGNKFFTYKTNAEEYFDNNDFKNFFVENKIKVVFLASPGNPYGKTMSKEKMNFLIDLCEANDAYIIIDAVYSELYFNNEKPYYPTDRISKNVFYTNSFSKKFSITGWRIGYFLFHESHFEQISYIHDYTGLSSPAPQQQAIAKFLETEDSKTYVTDLRAKIIENLNIANDALKSAGFYCPSNDGGYFVWAKLPNEKIDGLAFGLDLYDNTRTAVIPGAHFGKEWSNYIRINIARETPELVTGVNNIIKFVNQIEKI